MSSALFHVMKTSMHEFELLGGIRKTSWNLLSAFEPHGHFYTIFPTTWVVRRLWCSKDLQICVSLGFCKKEETHQFRPVMMRSQTKIQKHFWKLHCTKCIKWSMSFSFHFFVGNDNLLYETGECCRKIKQNKNKASQLCADIFEMKKIVCRIFRGWFFTLDVHNNWTRIRSY